jgi:hypothetical protein
MAIPVTRTETTGDKIKLLKLMTFNKTYSKLKTFLVNIEIHIKANRINNNKKKIIFVASCFTDAAVE